MMAERMAVLMVVRRAEQKVVKLVEKKAAGRDASWVEMKVVL